jgi:hypothetical protein
MLGTGKPTKNLMESYTHSGVLELFGTTLIIPGLKENRNCLGKRA